MKRFFICLFFVVALCCTPFLLFPEGSAAPLWKDIMSTEPVVPSDSAQEAEAAAPDEEATEPAGSETVSQPFDSQVTLRVLVGGEVTEMTVADYLKGTLAAEMPSDFPMEALKAQAVASRTFALKQAEAGKHSNADICTDSSCCQGWTSEMSDEAMTRFSQAVAETDGLVVTYGDSLIDATFFSCSGGRTEAAVAVWGSDIPYLQSVESPGEENAPRYQETVVLDADYFADLLQEAYPEMNLSGPPRAWFGPFTRTEGGGLDIVFIGGVRVEGTTLRRLFSLRSTNLDISVTEDNVQITTTGFGHRVGMSQYGARAMAEGGTDFEEILLHYYTGTEIKKLLCQTAEQ